MGVHVARLAPHLLKEIQASGVRVSVVVICSNICFACFFLCLVFQYKSSFLTFIPRSVVKAIKTLDFTVHEGKGWPMRALLTAPIRRAPPEEGGAIKKREKKNNPAGTYVCCTCS